MKLRRGKTIAIASVLLGLALLAAGGFAFRDRIAAGWNRFQSLKVTGKVHFLGTPPPRPPPITAHCDPNCAALNPTPVYLEDAVHNANGTLKNVLVYVSAGLEPKEHPVPFEPSVLELKRCRFVPHIFAIRARQQIQIQNSDNTLHNPHFLPVKNAQLNFGMPMQGMAIKKSLARPEPPFKIKCEVHNCESAWCAVFDHPYFAVTDEKGQYEIRDLPPGTYTLTAWHEKYGVETQEIRVPWLGSRAADFDYAPDQSATAR